MSVTALVMDNFDSTKMNAHFTTCLWKGLIHEWKQTLPHRFTLKSLKKKHDSVPHKTTVQPLWVLEHSTIDKLCILVKAQPSTWSTRLQSPTRLGIRLQDLGLHKKIQSWTLAFLQVIPRMSNSKMSNPRMSNPKMPNAKMFNRVLTQLVQF